VQNSEAQKELAVEVRDVSKRYGRRWALARLSCSVRVGQSLLLTGPNGAGKTTLLRLIATDIIPTAGTLRVFGVNGNSHRESIRERVGLLSHSNFLYEDLSAEQNLMLTARLLGLDSPRDRVKALLERVGLSDRASSTVRQFSAGMRKRLAIARLLLKSPALVLLDEPFGALDPEGIAQMEQIVSGLRDGGATIVLATHLVEQGKALSDERLHLVDGRLAAP
jgi:heme exporter protein A